MTSKQKIEYADVLPGIREQFISECSVVRKHMKTASNLFHASCSYHDWMYTAGGTEKDRAEADRGFYRRCIMNAASIPNVGWIWYYSTVALVWYLAVRLIGWTAFEYGPYRSVSEILILNQKTKSSTGLGRFKALVIDMYNNVRMYIIR